MPTITLAQPWKYCTPLVTVDFPAGEHDVSEAIAAAALADPAAQAAIIEQETEDGHRTATPRAPRRAAKAKG
ncbi:hypothetical protein [Synechococcus phage Yong-M3-232]|nr:hypothetical protein [Synechococcus phage Yong-M3-232]